LRTLTAVALSAVLLLLIAATPASAAPNAFKLGVTAGDVSSSSAIVWGRANHSGRVRLVVARNRSLTRARRRFVLRALRSDDATVQKRVRGLGSGPPLLVPLLPGTRAQRARHLPHRPRA
jgi:phosphodiesterase/alkaline phosphatase D-like protein